MSENVANLGRLGRRLFALLILVGCTLFVTAPPAARADDPISCQHACFNTMVNCCSYYAYCNPSCGYNYYSCGSQCGNFQGKNCHNRAADAYESCINNGDEGYGYGCQAGDFSCCWNLHNDVLMGCLYP